MDPRQKSLVAAAMKRRMAAYAPDEEEVMVSEENQDMPDVELADDEAEQPSLREQLNAEPLAGGGEMVEEMAEGDEEPVDMDEELRMQLSQNGKGGALLQRVLEMLSKKKKG